MWHLAELLSIYKDGLANKCSPMIRLKSKPTKCGLFLFSLIPLVASSDFHTDPPIFRPPLDSFGRNNNSNSTYETL